MLSSVLPSYCSPFNLGHPSGKVIFRDGHLQGRSSLRMVIPRGRLSSGASEGHQDKMSLQRHQRGGVSWGGAVLGCGALPVHGSWSSAAHGPLGWKGSFSLTPTLLPFISEPEAGQGGHCGQSTQGWGSPLGQPCELLCLQLELPAISASPLSPPCLGSDRQGAAAQSQACFCGGTIHRVLGAECCVWVSFGHCRAGWVSG